MESYNRKAIFSELKKYCHLSDEHDFIEVTQWNNGEGVDVHISNKGNNQKIEMTWGQWSLLKKMIKKLYKEE